MTPDGTKMTNEEISDLPFMSLLDEEENKKAGQPGCHFAKKYREKQETKGKATRYQYLSEYIHYNHVTMKPSELNEYLLPPRVNYVQLHFCLHGKCFYKDLQTGSLFFENTGAYHNMIYRGGGHLQFYPDNTQSLEIVLINVHCSFFKKYYELPDEMGAEFLVALKTGINTTLSPSNLPINANILSLLHALIKITSEDTFKRNLIEAKIIELMTMQFQSFVEFSEKGDQANFLSPEEIERMNQVKNILMCNMENPLTLKTLAKEVGTNEFHLKKHFKAVFGKTVFAYLLERKMELAKSHILNTDKSIAEIGTEFGFKYPTHFTAAFKKYFGYLPNQLRRN